LLFKTCSLRFTQTAWGGTDSLRVLFYLHYASIIYHDPTHQRIDTESARYLCFSGRGGLCWPAAAR
jgi:hypothetical protein